MNSPHIKNISKQRFAALTYAVHPAAHLVLEEISWFSDINEHLLAVIVYDKVDEDWGYIILARNEKHIFNSIDVGHSIKELANAKAEMIIKLSKYANSDEKIHNQGDGIRDKQDIFKSLSHERKLHKNFVLLRDDEGLTPAKRIIQEVALIFVDCDGFFFKRFQTTEFDQRIWELYLYAYLHEEHFEIINEYSSPDYLCKKEKVHICIEATTVNPPSNDVDKRAYVDPNFEPNDEYCCIKFGKSLMRKLQMKYWEKPHVKNKPLIIAIQSFENLIDSNSLATYVYGISHSWEKNEAGELVIIPNKIQYHENQGRQIKSGFFSMPDSEYISAVLFSNSGTISKFNRMGRLAGFGSKRLKMIRTGCCVNPDPNTTIPQTFSVEISPDRYSETWAQGLNMLHNPHALHPVNPRLFPNIEHYYLEDDQVVCRSYNKFIPINSVTMVLLIRE